MEVEAYNIPLVTEADIECHRGNDLVNLENCVQVNAHSLSDIVVQVEQIFSLPKGEQQLWPLVQRKNNAIRPIFENTDTYGLHQIEGFYLTDTLERPKNSILLFFKYYNPNEKSLIYLGKLFIPRTWEIEKTMRYVRTDLIMDKSIELEAWEEISPQSLSYLESDSTLDSVNLGDGDIVIVQDTKTLSTEPTLPSFLGVTFDERMIEKSYPKSFKKRVSVDDIIVALPSLHISEVERIFSSAFEVLQKKKQESKCVKCKKNERQILFETCQHLCICHTCLVEHYVEDGKFVRNVCPLCGKKFDRAIPVLYS